MRLAESYQASVKSYNKAIVGYLPSVKNIQNVSMVI